MKDFYKKILTIALLVLVAVTTSVLADWKEPTEAPTGGNIEAPINVSSTDQTKTGGVNARFFGAQNLIAVTDVTSPKYCIGANCITSWSQVGSGSGSSITSTRYLGAGRDQKKDLKKADGSQHDFCTLSYADGGGSSYAICQVYKDDNKTKNNPSDDKWILETSDYHGSDGASRCGAMCFDLK